MKQIAVVPYHPDWPNIYQQEAGVIQAGLGNNFIAVHHVGSTSVPDLDAKPRIDIIAIVKDSQAVIPMMEKIGYIFKGSWNIPFKWGFTKRNPHQINCHIFEENHPEITLNLLLL